MNELILGLVIVALIAYIIYIKKYDEPFLETQMGEDMTKGMARENFGSTMGEDMTRRMASAGSKWEGSLQDDFESFADYKADGYNDIHDGDGSYTDYIAAGIDPLIQKRHTENFIASMKKNDPARMSAVASATRFATRETPPPPVPWVGFSIPRAQKIDYNQRQVPEIMEGSYAQDDVFRIRM